MNDRAFLELVRQADPLTETVGGPPSALLERVLASPRTGKPPRRLRWQARVALVVAVVAVSGTIAALAIAGAGWLTGTPAPPQVVTDFQNYDPQLGFHPEQGGAVLVAQDGRVGLYATTDREGTYCLALADPEKPIGTPDSGVCLPKWIASGHFIAGNLGGTRTTLVVGGRIADPQARSVRFTGPDGSIVRASIGSSGFFVAATTTSAVCANAKGDWSSTFTALDADGNVLARTPVLSLAKLRTWHSPLRRGPLSACLWSGLQQ